MITDEGFIPETVDHSPANKDKDDQLDLRFDDKNMPVWNFERTSDMQLQRPQEDN